MDPTPVQGSHPQTHQYDNLPATPSRRSLPGYLGRDPATQKRISVDKWHRCLGEIRSMSLTLMGSPGLFIQMQKAHRHVKGKWVTLTRGVHALLASFQWLAE